MFWNSRTALIISKSAKNFQNQFSQSRKFFFEYFSIFLKDFLQKNKFCVDFSIDQILVEVFMTVFLPKNLKNMAVSIDNSAAIEL